MDWTELSAEERRAACAQWIACGGRAEQFVKSSDQLPLPGEDPSEHAAALNARLLDPGDGEFPHRVRGLVSPAGPWFVRGELPAGPKLGVVGTRAVDHEGTRLTTAIVRNVAASGIAIVSGGAIGVDTLAHEAALSVGGTTVAILPSAFDRLSPTRNKPLFARIPASGALVSEYPSGVSPRRYHFHRRNELIAAYSDAVLVIRSKAVGGTMITARAALRMRTPLLVVPGSPEDQTAAGCNALLRQDARCVTCAAEVFEELGLVGSTSGEVARARPNLSSVAAMVLETIERQPCTTDVIYAASGAAISDVMVAMTELELAGCVELRNGKWTTRQPGRG